MDRKCVKLSKLLYWVVLFLLLYTSDSVYTCVYHELDNYIEIITEMIMLSFIAFLDRKRVITILSAIGGISFIMLLLSMLHIQNTEYLYMLVLILRILAALVFAGGCLRLRYDFYYDMSSMIYYIAVLGLICYLLFEINPFGILPHYSYITIPNGDHTAITRYLNYCNIYYRWDTRTISFFGLKLVRENGFFREVGVYVIFLNFALIYFLFNDWKQNKKKIIVLVISILLAQSTMGLLIMIIVFSFKLLSNDYKLTFVLIPFVLILAYIFYVVATDKFEGGMKVAGRYRNLKYAMSIIIDNPIAGVGCHRKYLSWYGLLNYFIFFGIAGVFPIYIIVNGLIKNKNGLCFSIAFFMWYFLSLMNETAGYNLFFISLYSMIAFKCMLDGNMFHYEIRKPKIVLVSGR